MTTSATRHGSLWTRTDWTLVVLLTASVTVGVFLGSMMAFAVQGWWLLRSLP